MKLEQTLILLGDVQCTIVLEGFGNRLIQYKPTRNLSERGFDYLAKIPTKALTETVVTRIKPTAYRYANIYVVPNEYIRYSEEDKADRKRRKKGGNHDQAESQEQESNRQDGV